MPFFQTTHFRSCNSGSHTLWLAFALAFALVVWFGGSATAQSLVGQQQGWHAPETLVLPANQPVSIDPFRASADGGSLTNDVRRQIGLATFEEAAEQGRAAPQENDNQRATSPESIGPAGLTGPTSDIASLFNSQANNATSPDGIWPSIKVALLLAVLSLAPAIVLMTTCYVRVVVVLTLLRQAFGGQQLPPMQVMTALSLFLTLLIMAPVWNEVKTEAIDPYTRQQNPIGWEEAWQRGIAPVKHFMISQIKASGNSDSVAVFYKHLPDAGPLPSSIEQVPINVLLPAFLISELKVAFLLGFQIFLPFLILDLVVSSVTVSSGMLMLPPTMVSFPLKLILFVMVDGWNLVVGMLLQSFAPI
jgi:flagellar biosynthetic protein FliP